MNVEIDKKLKCDGYNNYNTIVIFYDFPNGKNYTGTRRRVFLPDNEEGR